MPDTANLKSRIAGGEFDYLALLHALREYARPRDRITDLLRQGEIVRVKKGIYVFGEGADEQAGKRTSEHTDEGSGEGSGEGIDESAGDRPVEGSGKSSGEGVGEGVGEGAGARPFSREVLANLICGPSYLSLDSALYHHGLIPERPAAVTSVVFGRPRRFSTPVGLFIYRPLSFRPYRIGIDLAVSATGRPFLIAIPEKALVDKVHDERGTAILTLNGMTAWLVENLRITPERLAGLDIQKLAAIRDSFGSRKIRLLHNVVRQLATRKARTP
ncbi:MAG: type IV toxin-antitoxin system AbiEi family antitoxin domain-containing protein [Syntrophales bacterium]